MDGYWGPIIIALFREFVLPVLFAIPLIAYFWSQELKEWWSHPESDEERERSLGGFWLRQIKIWFRRPKSDDDFTT